MASLGRRDPEERPDNFFRFSVKCDRLTNIKIAAAAGKAGMTVNSFVQRHFDRILEAPVAPVEAVPPTFDAAAFSIRHNVTIQAANLWFVLATHARDGVVQRTLRDLAVDLGVHRAEPLVEQLIATGMLVVVRTASGARPALYRVISEG